MSDNSNNNGLLDRMVVKGLSTAVVVLGLFLAFGITAGIVFRVLFDTPLFGLEELVLMAAMWLYMLGAGLASHERSHLSADFVQVFSKNRKVTSVFKVISTCIALVMAGFFISWSYSLVAWAVERGQVTPVFSIPLYVPQASFLVASVLMFVYLVRDLVGDIRSLMNGDGE